VLVVRFSFSRRDIGKKFIDRERFSLDDWRHSGSATSEGATAATFSNFFTDVRVHQIREMQEQVVTKEGIPSFDFGEVWEGFQNYQQMVHPLIVRPSSPLCSPFLFSF
jgi:hypothetical protein